MSSTYIVLLFKQSCTPKPHSIIQIAEEASFAISPTKPLFCYKCILSIRRILGAIQILCCMENWRIFVPLLLL